MFSELLHVSYVMLYSAGVSKGSLECRTLLLVFRAAACDKVRSHAAPITVCLAVAIVADMRQKGHFSAFPKLFLLLLQESFLSCIYPIIKLQTML